MLDATDVVEFPDELSIITYVSFFRQYLSKFAAYAPNCYAEGPGLKDALTFTPAHFTVFAVDEQGNKVTRGGAFLRVMLLDAKKKSVAKVAIKDNLDGIVLTKFNQNCVFIHQLHLHFKLIRSQVLTFARTKRNVLLGFMIFTSKLEVHTLNSLPSTLKLSLENLTLESVSPLEMA